jgi:hypothetical protein
MQAIFQPLEYNEKWWYMILMAPRTKPLFHSLLPESGQLMDTDHTMSTSDQRGNNRTLNPSGREEIDESWVAAQLLHNDVECAHADTGSLLDTDADDVDEADPDLAPKSSEYDEAAINTDPSVNLGIELGSGDMIDIDEDTNIFLTINIDPFLVIDSYADHNS